MIASLVPPELPADSARRLVPVTFGVGARPLPVEQVVGSPPSGGCPVQLERFRRRAGETMKEWSSLCDAVVVITLREVSDRRREVLGELCRCALLPTDAHEGPWTGPPVFFYVADRPGPGKSGIEGCLVSHRSVWRLALASGWSRFAVFEDDFVTNGNFSGGSLSRVRECFEDSDLSDASEIAFEAALQNPLRFPVSLIALGSFPFRVSDPAPFRFSRRNVYFSDIGGGLHAYVATAEFAERCKGMEPHPDIATSLFEWVDARLMASSLATRDSPGVFLHVPSMFDQRQNGTDIGPANSLFRAAMTLFSGADRNALEAASLPGRAEFFAILAAVAVVFVVVIVCVALTARRRRVRGERKEGAA